ncbi:MAG TPA: acyltransferase [Opitutaceae bacterium]|nr:acyltransferase [Opitutaceae bacterium]
MAWLTQNQIENMKFGAVGTNVLLSDKASYYNCANIRMGSNVRIDDFCVLSAGEGGIHLGDYVHIAVYASLIGKGRIELESFSGLSSRVSVYSSNEDYSGAKLTNPTVPAAFSGVTHADVRLCKHVIVGAGSIILPGVTLGEGAAVGALSVVRRDCEPFAIYMGAPAKRIMKRKSDLLELEKQLRAGQPG